MGQYTAGRDSLANILTFEEEESLKCVATLCLAYTMVETDVHLKSFEADGRASLLQFLLSHIYSADRSTRRRHHGFPMYEILNALSAFAVNEPIQSMLLYAKIEKIANPKRPRSSETQPVDCMSFLIKLLDVFKRSDGDVGSISAENEANAVIRMLYHMVFNPEIKHEEEMKACVKTMEDLMFHPSVVSRRGTALFRVLENAIWQSSQPSSTIVYDTYTLPDPNHCGPIVMSYAPINRLAVQYFVEQLRAAGLPIWNDTVDTVIQHESAQDVGLSALAGTVADQTGWFQCLKQATVMIACLSDAYRLSPGCRSEVESFIRSNTKSRPKVIIYIILPPRFHPNGWVSRLPGITEALDFTHRKTFIESLRELVTRAGKPYGVTVANAPLDSFTLDSVDGHRNYISIEDLNALKSSSIFLSSTDSPPSRHSEITQTVEQMLSKGGLRQGSAVRTSSSTSVTQLHSSGSDELKQNQEGNPPAPITDVSGSKYEEDKAKEIFSPMQGKEENTTEAAMLDTPKTENIPYPFDGKQSVPMLIIGEHQSKGNLGSAEPETKGATRSDEIELPDQEGLLKQPARKEVSYMGSHSDTTDVNLGTMKTESVCGMDVFNKPEQTPIASAELPASEDKETNSIHKEIPGATFSSSDKPRTPPITPTVPHDSIQGHADGRPDEIVSHTEHERISLRESYERNAEKESVSQTGLQQAKGFYQDVPQTIVTGPEDSTEHDKDQKVKVQHAPTGVLSTTSEIGVGTSADWVETQAYRNDEIGSQREANLKDELSSDDHKESKTSKTDTSKQQNLSPETSGTLSTLRAVRISGIKARHIQDISVQTLSPVEEIKSMPTWSSSVNTPGQLIGATQISAAAPTDFILGSHVKDTRSSPMGIQDIVRPQVRNWSAERVTEWFNSKGLQHLPQKLCGVIDGVVLSQLVCLRHWAPEYFAKSIRTELGLTFIEGLRLVEAMEELTRRRP
ncbi:unnamed protein product [Dicrocoelium dendriticum]|nr:unnamed protein product [Dicrocoelium dendriticum]